MDNELRWNRSQNGAVRAKGEGEHYTIRPAHPGGYHVYYRGGCPIGFRWFKSQKEAKAFAAEHHIARTEA